MRTPALETLKRYSQPSPTAMQTALFSNQAFNWQAQKANPARDTEVGFKENDVGLGDWESHSHLIHQTSVLGVKVLRDGTIDGSMAL